MVAKVFFDTSVLVSGLASTELPRDDARRLLVAVAQGRLLDPRTAWHCCLEFFAVSTRLPEEFRLSPTVALDLLRTQILARFQVQDLLLESRGGFLADLEQLGIAGGQVYDLHIAEIARNADVDTVVTNNRRHFVSLLRHGIRVLTAAELVQELGL